MKGSPDPMTLLQAHPIFQYLTERETELIARLAVLENYPTPTLLARQGVRPAQLRYVVAGRADLVARDEDGQTATLPIPQGGWVTWLGVFCPQPQDHEIWTTANAQYLSFPAQSVLELVEGNRHALAAALNLVATNMRLLIGWMHVTSLGAPERRMAYLLLALAPSGQTTAEPIRISHEEIGQMGFGSRQFVGRVLRSMEQQGLIALEYREVGILDHKRLLDFARTAVRP